VVEMLLSEKLTFIMIFMTIIFLVISGDSGLEVFFVLILIGVLILRELIETFAPNDLKDRMNFFIYTGLIIFVGIVVNKIIDVLG
jgi:hypothetical protein